MNRAAATPLPPAPARDEIRALTALRTIAALLVFLYHFAPDARGLLGIAAAQGHVGVTLFFVLSGFLITARYAADFAAGTVALGDFFVRRVARIVPLYLVVLALACWASGEPPFTWARLPEWTLTQGFFSRSLHDLVVPTSWSLTVEECFYASAPVLLALVAALGRRVGAARAALVVLGGAVCVLLCAGLLVVALVPEALRESLGFLGTRREMLEHTFFGRFWEFAVGALCALAWRSGVDRGFFIRGRGPLLASLASLGCLAAIVASEGAMARAGDPWGRGWEAAWAWNAPVAVASGLLILSLTSARSPVARFLGLRPFVYLGRISYALYLVQVTPLGKDLLYRWLPAEQPAYVLVLYLGMNAVAALLFEVVEEPARRAVLRLWARRQGVSAPRARPPVATARRRLATLAALALLLAVQQGARALHLTQLQHGHPSLEHVRRTLDPGRILDTGPDEATDGDGEGYRVALPRRWMEGPPAERRSPTHVLVFADGRPVPFVSGEEASARAARGEPAASYKRPRTLVVSVSGLQVDRALTIVLQDSFGWLRLGTGRLGTTPSAMVTAALAWLAAVLLVGLALLCGRRTRPDRALRLGLAVTVAWLAFGGYAAPGALALFLLGVVFTLAGALPGPAGALGSRRPPLA